MILISIKEMARRENQTPSLTEATEVEEAVENIEEEEIVEGVEEGQ